MKITNLGHASFLIEGKDVSVVIDPYRDGSVPNLKMPRISANYAFKSHDHYDHDALNLVNIIPTDINLDYETIIVPHDHHNGTKRGLNKIHIFNIDGYKVIHTGDLGCIPGKEVLEQLKKADVILAPINGFYTVSAQELHEILHVIEPKICIPMHYFKAQDNSGYPDGGQIDIFKRLEPDYYEVNDCSIEINGNTLKKRVIIFNKELKG